MDRARNPRLTMLLLALQTGATLAVFWPLTRNGFIGYDDFEYLVQNPHVATGVTWANTKWAFTAFYSSNWHPVTWFSHMLDVQIFGGRTGWHHFITLLIHAANTGLLFMLLRRMTGAIWRSALVAAFFALHPLHVESVAWAAERKDVLSAFFFMLTLLAYAAYATKTEGTTGKQADGAHNVQAVPNPPSPLSSRASFYLLGLLFFALGLMSKPMLVTVPFVLLLLDYWPLARFNPQVEGFDARHLIRLVVEKAPFFALSAVSCVLTVLAQKQGGAVAPLEMLPFGARIENAFVAYLAYLQKMIWPTHLAIIYLRPDEWSIWLEALAAIVTVGFTLTALVLARAGSARYFSVGWLWYVGMLMPVIGVVQVGTQAFADRYTYLPLIGCFILLAWGGWELASRWRNGPKVATALACLALIGLGLAANRQARLWRNTETLLTHCLEVTTNNYMAHNILGVALSGQNRFEEAQSHFLEALRVQPAYAEALQNLGVLLVWHGDFEQAKSYLERAISVKPSVADAYSRVGFALDLQGRTRDAVACYREAVRHRPNDENACNDLAWILATCPDEKLRDAQEAVRLAEHACELTRTNRALFVGTLAAAYAEAGRFPEAIAAAQKAIALAEAARQEDLANKNRELLEIYRSGKPHHEPAVQASTQ
jgi:Flp pilus assembly protein TadD